MEEGRTRVRPSPNGLSFLKNAQSPALDLQPLVPLRTVRRRELMYQPFRSDPFHQRPYGGGGPWAMGIDAQDMLITLA